MHLNDFYGRKELNCFVSENRYLYLLVVKNVQTKVTGIRHWCLRQILLLFLKRIDLKWYLRDSTLREKIKRDQFFPGQQETYFFVAYTPSVTFNNKNAKNQLRYIFFNVSFNRWCFKSWWISNASELTEPSPFASFVRIGLI